MSTWSCGLQLRIISGPGKGLTHPIDSKQFSIGRARTTDDRQAGWFRLNDDAVSRLHAELFWDEAKKQFKLMHRSQTNLTYVNEEAVDETWLKAGDMIKMGAITLELQEAESRFAGDPEDFVLPLEQRADLMRAPSRSTFAVRTPREPAKAPAPVKRKVSIEVPSGFRLDGVSGESYELKGFKIAIASTLAGGDEKPFDQEHLIEGLDAELLIDWDEREKCFSLSRGMIGGEVSVTRKSDGISWKGVVGPGARVRLRAGDRIAVGEHEFVYQSAEKESKPVQAIKLEL